MDIAGLIISVIALLISSATLVIFLAKNVFSSHTIQMVPAESLLGESKSKPIGEDFEEFDAPSIMDSVLADKTAKTK